MCRQLEVLIHGLGHNDLAASSRVLLRQVFFGNEKTFENDFTSGSGHDKFFTVDPERPLSLPFQRYSLDHHRQSAGGEGFGKITFRRKVPRDEQTHSQEIKRSVSSMPSSLPAVLEMCRHKFVHLLFFMRWNFFVFRLWMYLTLSDVDICKAKEEGLKKLLKEYRFSKDVYRYPWLIIDDLLIQQQTIAEINKWDKKLTIECLVRWTVIWRWCKGWLNRWRTSKLQFLNHVQLDNTNI